MGVSSRWWNKALILTCPTWLTGALDDTERRADRAPCSHDGEVGLSIITRLTDPYLHLKNWWDSILVSDANLPRSQPVENSSNITKPQTADNRQIYAVSLIPQLIAEAAVKSPTIENKTQ